MLVVSERRASACLIMLSAKQGSHWYHFLTPLVWRGRDSNPRPPAPEADTLPFAPSGPVEYYCPGKERKNQFVRVGDTETGGILYSWLLHMPLVHITWLH